MNTKEFKPTYLYVKTHNKTGLKYFGKTSKLDPVKYLGSGKDWSRHLREYGFDFSTEIIGFFTDEVECRKIARQFSIDNDIVKSDLWANLREETLGGGAINDASIEKLKQTQIRTQGGVMKNARSQAYSAEAKAKRLSTMEERYGSKMPFMKQSPDWKEQLIKRNQGNTHAKDRIGIIKNGIKKLVLENELQNYIDLGWKKGYKE